MQRGAWCWHGGAVNGVQPGPIKPSPIKPSDAQTENLSRVMLPGKSGLASLVDAHYQLITEAVDLQAFLAQARAQGFVAVDNETTSLNAAAADLVGVAMALAPGQACYAIAPAAQPLVAGQTGLDFDRGQDTVPIADPV